MVLHGILLICLCTHFYVTRAAIAPRGGGGAALLNNVIYYYGGYTTINATDSTTGGDTNDLLKLDLSTLDFSNLTYNWQQINPTPGALTYGGENLNVVAVNNRTQMVVHGWWTVTNSLTYQVFNPVIGSPITNNWQSISFPSDPSYQIPFFGGVVDIPSLHSLWFWGGINAFGNETWSSMPYVYLYDYIQNQFSLVNSPTPSNITMHSFTPILSNDGQKIYVFCGAMESPAANTNNMTRYEDSRCELVPIYDVMSTRWSYINASMTSTRVPTARVHHTVTLIPGTTTVFIYGGIQAYQYTPQVVNDAAYTFDLSNNSFSYVTLGNSDNRPGSLAGHEAVYYETQGKRLILMLFGRDSGTSLSKYSTNIIDVTDLSQLAWFSSFASNDNGSGGSHLSTGAIAGIAVGAAVAGIGITAALIYLFWRRRKQKQQFQLETTDPRHSQPLFFPPEMTHTHTVTTSQDESATYPIIYSKPSMDEHDVSKPYDQYANYGPPAPPSHH